MNTVQTHTFEHQTVPKAKPPLRLTARLHASYARVLPFFVLGVALFLTNHWFTAVDDECAIIDRAARPFSQTVRAYLLGYGEHEHPPLYDLLLHGWLRLTNANQLLLRLPAIVFYVLGAWILAAAAKRRAGNAAWKYTAALVCFWPYGFHFGRLATWYSLGFLLVALLTWNYLRYIEGATFGRWLCIAACSLLLIYCNYFGWAMIGCLALDFIIERRTLSVKTWAGLAGTCLLLVGAYLPIKNAFLTELHAGAHLSGNALKNCLNGLYDLYSVFVSESVAPWFWVIGIPAAVAIAACVVITFFAVRGQTRRFLVYFAGLLAVLAVLGIANTKRMLFISPWLILPIAAALAQTASPNRQRILCTTLVFIGAIGWYGIFSRSLYAAPHWLEPWEGLGRDAAAASRNGGIVIGNNPSFFFYLTYDLAPIGIEGPHGFDGLLPDSTRRANVYSGAQWRDAGHPLATKMMLVEGPHYQIPNAPMDEAEQWLDHRCVVQNRQHLVHDAGAELKEHFLPEAGQLPWRIEVATFECR
jgi:hypothetical protein